MNHYILPNLIEMRFGMHSIMSFHELIERQLKLYADAISRNFLGDAFVHFRDYNYSEDRVSGAYMRYYGANCIEIKFSIECMELHSNIEELKKVFKEIDNITGKVGGVKDIDYKAIVSVLCSQFASYQYQISTVPKVENVMK